MNGVIRDARDQVDRAERNEALYRDALKEIRASVERDIEGDGNPNKGMLMRVSRIAGEALREP